MITPIIHGINPEQRYVHRRWSVYRLELYADVHPARFQGKLTNLYDTRNNLRK